MCVLFRVLSLSGNVLSYAVSCVFLCFFSLFCSFFSLSMSYDVFCLSEMCKWLVSPALLLFTVLSFLSSFCFSLIFLQEFLSFVWVHWQWIRGRSECSTDLRHHTGSLICICTRDHIMERVLAIYTVLSLLLHVWQRFMYREGLLYTSNVKWRLNLLPRAFSLSVVCWRECCDERKFTHSNESFVIFKNPINAELSFVLIRWKAHRYFCWWMPVMCRITRYMFSLCFLNRE